MAIYESLSRGDRYSTENTNETLSFEEQRVSDGLNAADAQLPPTRLAFVEGEFDRYGSNGAGHEIVFEGAFTYEVDGSGAIDRLDG